MSLRNAEMLTALTRPEIFFATEPFAALTAIRANRKGPSTVVIQATEFGVGCSTPAEVASEIQWPHRTRFQHTSHYQKLWRAADAGREPASRDKPKGGIRGLNQHESAKINVVSGSQIKLIDSSTGKLFPAAPSKSVLLSSAGFGWRGFSVELHNLAPMEMAEHQIEEHRLMVQAGKPVSFEWKNGSRWQQKQFKTGDFSLQTHGDLNAPRWMENLEIIAIALEPKFVGRIFQDTIQSDQISFQARRCESDETIARFAAHFKDELENASYAGKLYGESLAMAFSFHLLERYGDFSVNLKMPHGKLASANLRRALEFVHENLAEDLSIEDIARESYLSAFHFARLFKNTLGLTPHQYVLRNRIERAQRLIAKSPQLNLTEIGLSVGFFDQAHFTKAFKRATGATPKAFHEQTI